ncbi:MAG: NADH-quinone oxidoreductase subunit F [Oscillospiraceae bacterium]|nr:NADH-quinone oxidoreductase subunit F [Oscillospiraceae bacterium]
MRITVGKGSCGIAAGASEVFDRLEGGLLASDSFSVTATGCIGTCYLEPIVNVEADVEADTKVHTFVRVTPAAAAEILKFARNLPSDAGKYAIAPEDLDVLGGQQRIALRNCGVINPESIDEYMARQGYEAYQTCVQARTPEEVIEEIKISGLSGRGGAGFPTWFKWNAARGAPGEEKYIICNADEGDPGAFMDRALIEGDPHAVLEGMMIAAYAIGAREGMIYVRAEYPLAIIRLGKALEQAREKGLLGEGIMGRDFSFDIRIKAGAGAFVCGEETALIASLEGERGMPRIRPPFPAQSGYRRKPSNINNVETYANIPWIIRSGGAAFAAMGTENSKGAKVFALAGKIAKGGLVEVAMGKTINDVVYGVGGGITGGKAFKAVQMGGPSGGCIPASLGDTMIDYRTLAATGAIMGSGGMVVMDESTCMVDIARFFLDFTCKESCGKCTHCRVGNRRMLEILDRICDGHGQEGDVDLLYNLAVQIKDGSLCALGQTAPNPVLTTIRYFRHEYEDHILHKKCTAHHCKQLLTYTIDDKQCIGCTMCALECAANAIEGRFRQAHAIDQEKCDKCGVCAEMCHAVSVE